MDISFLAWKQDDDYRLMKTLHWGHVTYILALFLFLFLNEALSAKKTIAELWDGRLRGGTLVWIAPNGGVWSPPGVAARAASWDSPLRQGSPGGRPRGAHARAPHPGRGYPSGFPRGASPIGAPSIPLATAAPVRNA